MKQMEFVEKEDWEEHTSQYYKHLYGKFECNEYDLYQITQNTWVVRENDIRIMDGVSKNEIIKRFPFMRKALKEIKSVV